MQRLEGSCAVRPIYGLLGAKELTAHFHLEQMLKKEQSSTSTPPLGLHGLF
jgi:hypothetical protein